ncbi:hypothetical protein BO85DRAFT_215556 [Aspergillus piperis CBS 112811]|uniref:Uncharacterized protein n=1 Tax=Aspergillus piperis CBS 112811 TaxID=1448313 RepID=A0A8G1QRY7_9EURO|nr:hypothetical protein BO85DRAFT_215556 [Aspergillus piperis CBS 112811]RAH51826.1 hypothetical protein BO85DRAFT_215556 [Aspergillus piperis CBS 112811]
MTAGIYAKGNTIAEKRPPSPSSLSRRGYMPAPSSPWRTKDSKRGEWNVRVLPQGSARFHGSVQDDSRIPRLPQTCLDPDICVSSLADLHISGDVLKYRQLRYYDDKYRGAICTIAGAWGSCQSLVGPADPRELIPSHFDRQTREDYYSVGGGGAQKGNSLRPGWMTLNGSFIRHHAGMIWQLLHQPGTHDVVGMVECWGSRFLRFTRMG